MSVALRALAHFAIGLLLVLLALSEGACGFSPSIADGTIGCSSGTCPPGLTCAADGRCYGRLGPACTGGVPCPPGRQCSAGACVCSGCDSTTSDGCDTHGGCQCGEGAACGAGQHCVSGACTCDAKSCSN